MLLKSIHHAHSGLGSLAAVLGLAGQGAGEPLPQRVEHLRAPVVLSEWKHAMVWLFSLALCAALGWLAWRLQSHMALRKASWTGADEAQEQFLAAASFCPDALLLVTPVRNRLGRTLDYRLNFANEAAQQMFTGTQTGLNGRRLSSLFPELLQGEVLNRLKNLAQTGTTLALRTRLGGEGAGERLLQLKAISLPSGLALTLHDGSAEQTHSQEMAVMRNFSEALIKDAPFSVILCNASGTVTAMNEAAVKLTRYHRQELVGQQNVSVLHEEEEVRTRATGRETLPHGSTFAQLMAALRTDRGKRAEWTYRRPDGTCASVQLGMTALYNAAGDLTGYMFVAFDVSEAKSLTDSVSFIARHDSLTRLPNRMLLHERAQAVVADAQTAGERVALFMIDLDHFKRINESLGHSGGDELLVVVASRLMNAVRDTDMVARSGGDEFVVLMPAAGNSEEVERCGVRLLEALSAPIVLHGREISVTGSIGVCVFPDCSADFEYLLRNAEAALSAAKGAGRSTVRIFTDRMLAREANRLEMEAELRYSLERNQMVLHFQPLMDCRTMRMLGAEALVRWQHPTRGLIAPAVFVPLAEDSGFIHRLGEWVLRAACLQGHRMQVELGRRFTICVNLSTKQLQSGFFVDKVVRALEDSGLAPEDLEFEITESTLMTDSEETMCALGGLRAMGVRLAIDDFGTGFSNFQYILDHKVETIKIDRSFLSKCPEDSTAMAVVRGIIAMAHGLQMKVIAEGVETPQQLEFLQRRRCDLAQGYYFARPMPEKDLMALLQGSPDAVGFEGYTEELLLPGGKKAVTQGLPI